VSREGKNPGCRANCGQCNECVSALPFGASCAATCANVATCRERYGLKGSEGACRFIPSQFTQAKGLPVVDYAAQASV